MRHREQPKSPEKTLTDALDLLVRTITLEKNLAPIGSLPTANIRTAILHLGMVAYRPKAREDLEKLLGILGSTEGEPPPALQAAVATLTEFF